MDHRLRRWVDVGPGEIYFLGQVLKDELTLSAPLHTQTELLEGQWVDMVLGQGLSLPSHLDTGQRLNFLTNEGDGGTHLPDL